MSLSKILRLSGVVISVVVVQACRLNYPVPKTDEVVVRRSPELVSEGKRLSMLMCAGCHYDEETKRLLGRRMDDIPRIVGKVYSANLTNDPSSKVYHYTDHELKNLLRTGISRDGRFMPYMLRPNLADKDIDAIISFLRSDDKLVSPMTVNFPDTRYSMVGKFAISRAKPVALSPERIERPTADTLELGRYLVDNLGCYHCHSRSFLTLDYRDPEQSKGYLSGGKVKGPDGKSIRTPSLTFHEAGLNGWTLEDFTLLLRSGITPFGTPVRYPMSQYPELNASEVRAIYVYLRQLPEIDND